MKFPQIQIPTTVGGEKKREINCYFQHTSLDLHGFDFANPIFFFYLTSHRKCQALLYNRIPKQFSNI